MKPRILDRLIDLVSQSFSRSPGQPRAERRRAKRLTQLCHALLSERGEVSGARLARPVGAKDDKSAAGVMRVS